MWDNVMKIILKFRLIFSKMLQYVLDPILMQPVNISHVYCKVWFWLCYFNSENRDTGVDLRH